MKEPDDIAFTSESMTPHNLTCKDILHRDINHAEDAMQSSTITRPKRDTRGLTVTASEGHPQSLHPVKKSPTQRHQFAVNLTIRAYAQKP